MLPGKIDSSYSNLVVTDETLPPRPIKFDQEHKEVQIICFGGSSQNAAK